MLTSPAVVLLAWGGVAALRRVRASARLRGALLGARAVAPACWPPTRCSTTPRTSRPRRAIEELASLELPLRRPRARRCSPTSTNTRCMSCATSTWAGPTSSIRRPRSPARPAGYGDPVRSRSAGARGAARLPADHHPPRPRVRAARRPPTRLRGRAPTTRCGSGAPARRRPRSHVALRGHAGRAVPRIRRLGDARRRPAGRAPVRRRARPSSCRFRCDRSRPSRRLGPERAGLAMTRAGRLSAHLLDARARASGRCGCRARSCPRVRRGRGRASRWPRSPGSSTATRSCSTRSPRSASASRRARTGCRSPAAASPSLPATAGRRCSTRIFLTPAGAAPGEPARRCPSPRWRSLCGRPLEWVEVVGG